MEDILNQLKKTAFKAKDEAEKFTKNVVKKSSDIVSQTKLNLAINENERCITQILESIGQYVYDEHKKGIEFTGDIGEKCTQVDKLNDELETIKQRVAELKNSVVCQSCGSYNKIDSCFCSKCGAELVKEYFY